MQNKRENYLKQFDKRQEYYKLYYQTNKDKYKQIYNEHKQSLSNLNKEKTIKNKQLNHIDLDIQDNIGKWILFICSIKTWKSKMKVMNFFY